MKKVYFFLFAFITLSATWAQEESNNLIQFSGVVVTMDSLSPVPFATIMVKNTSRGTTSDYYGYFSFVAQPNDTLIFSSIGFKDSDFIVPNELEGNRYSLIHSMLRDTVELDEVEIFPWPTPAQFKEAFLALDLPDDDLEIMRRNLSEDLMADKAAALPMNGSLNFKFQNQQRANQLYFAGQYRPNNLLNPIAWAQFIQAWKRGDFKKKD
mgnify:FL=1|tara:strand:+ start:4486 stop:5115 length:630 start_codon:yes stop_codon:yes gene_type:complete